MQSHVQITEELYKYYIVPSVVVIALMQGSKQSYLYYNQWYLNTKLQTYPYYLTLPHSIVIVLWSFMGLSSILFI